MPEHFEQPPASQKPTFSVLDVSAADTLSLADPDVREQVQRYANWLAKQAENQTRHSSEEVNNYIKEATTLVKVGEHEIVPFAPFRPELSALRTFTTPQILTCCALAVLWLVAVLVFQLEALTVVISAITVIYTACLLGALLIAFKSFHSASEEHIDDEIVHLLKQANWPIYTVLCPLYREAQVVPQFVEAMQALDYPPEKLQILFLTEENDSQTRAAIRALSLPSNFQILMVPDGVPRTKPRACNYGLLHALGTYTVIYDAEDIPDPLQLKKAVLAFANADLQTVCVQAKLNFYNTTQNLLTRWFTAEYSTWFGFILPGLQATNFALPLGGTSNHFRTASLRALGGWDAYNVTEDCDLGLRIKRFQMKTVILDSTTLEEANPQLKNWLRQRSRWIKGYMQTYLVHMRKPFKAISEGNLYDFFSFQFVIGSRTGMLFFNLLMWLLLAFYLILRAKAIPVYHVLFPGPTLYLGAFCLIFGNFFYLYLHLLACEKRGDYHLVFWSLFIPIYWLLMSIAGIYAFIELLVKPHYWQKTVHGLHFKKGRQTQTAQEAAAFVRQQTQSLSPLRVVPRKNSDEVLRTITSMLKAIATLPLPVVSSQQKQAVQTSKKTKVRDLWLLASFILSCIMSVAACLYYFQHNDILLYNDGLAHMRLARMVFDSATPGLSQLGGVWVPLPHILMWPFIWNDYLWQTGLAGSFASMPCYVIAAIYLFLSARRLTGKSAISFVGVLVFSLNPNVLYLQTTPLSDVICIAAFTASGYYFLAWAQEGKTTQLILAAATTFLATLARYDGWALFLALLALVPIISWLRGNRWRQIQGDVLIFGILAGLGIALWIAWCGVVLGDPLYFQNGPYSAQNQQLVFLHHGTLYTYHNLGLSIKYYIVLSIQTIGYPFFALAALAVIVFVSRKFIGFRNNKNRAELAIMLAVLAFLVPFAFYVVSLFTGQAIIWVPGVVPSTAPNQLYNVRYGVQTVVPAALFLVILINIVVTKLKGRVSVFCHMFLVIVIIAQSVFISLMGIVTLQAGEFGFDCHITVPTDLYLAEHYNGGRILVDTYASNFNEAEDGIDLKNIVYDGSGALWKQGLRDPASIVDWVVANPGDLVSQNLDTRSPAFLAKFTLVLNVSGSYLYHKTKLPPLPNRALPTDLLHEHQACKNN